MSGSTSFVSISLEARRVVRKSSVGIRARSNLTEMQPTGRSAPNSHSGDCSPMAISGTKVCVGAGISRS